VVEETRQVFEWTEHDRFLDWFAGLVDGEGSFGIQPAAKGTTWLNRLGIALREDDLDILIEIQERLGFGVVCRVSTTGPDGNGTMRWIAASHADCYKLVKVFDAHPLRAKKARDYAVWREAVIENMKPARHRDKAKLRYLEDKIQLVRSFNAPEVEEVEPDSVQLTLPNCDRPGGDRVSETQTHAQTERGEVVR